VGHRFAVGEPQPLDAVHLGALGDLEGGGHLGGRGLQHVGEDLGGGTLPGGLEVVVEAAQLQRALDLAVHDLGADASPAHQQSLVDQGLDGLAHRGPGQAEACGEFYLVAQQTARRERPAFDRGLQLLGELEVEGHRTAAVDAEFERRGGVHFWFGHGPSVAVALVDGKLHSQVVRTKD
jgi:hypothetical protein